jgi:cbb3-type cytochrome oxidase subunit 3
VAVFFSVVLPVLAGICIIGVFFFVLRALSARSRVDNQAYGVGRVEVKQEAQVNLLRALVSFVLALIFLALAFVGPRIEAVFPAATPTPPPTPIQPTAAPTLTATVTVMPTSAQPTPTSPIPTATATLLPTATSTPQPLTATVTSGVGVYLRGAPTTVGAELEYLPEGTVLFVLEGQQDADELIWQEVQTQAGQAGWVAADFITINQP